MAHPPASQRPTSSAARAQAWTSIVTAFAIDHSELERAIKQELLHTALAKSGMAIQKATGGLSRYRIHVRSASAYLLALRGEKLVITTLEELLDSAPPSWKLRAVEGLAALNDPQCGPPLVKALSSSDKTLHQSAWRALGELGERGEGALLDALHSPDQHVRWHAARGLGQLGNAQGVDTLAEGLLDESVEVRWAAAHALANLDMQAMPAVLRVITSHPVNEPLRQVALHALHGMQSQKAQQTARPVIEALRGRMAGILAPLEARRVLAAIEH
jgi:HEAT repeat protein